MFKGQIHISSLGWIVLTRMGISGRFELGKLQPSLEVPVLFYPRLPQKPAGILTAGESQVSRISLHPWRAGRKRSLSPKYSGKSKMEAPWLNFSTQTGWTGVESPAPRAELGAARSGSFPTSSAPFPALFPALLRGGAAWGESGMGNNS